MISIVVALILQYNSKVCIFKLVMLVKLVFVMQRLKKYLKNFCHDQQRLGTIFRFYGGGGGGHSCYEGDIELMVVPLLGKTLSDSKSQGDLHSSTHSSGNLLVLELIHEIFPNLFLIKVPNLNSLLRCLLMYQSLATKLTNSGRTGGNDGVTVE